MEWWLWNKKRTKYKTNRVTRKKRKKGAKTEPKKEKQQIPSLVHLIFFLCFSHSRRTVPSFRTIVCVVPNLEMASTKRCPPVDNGRCCSSCFINGVTSFSVGFVFLIPFFHLPVPMKRIDDEVTKAASVAAIWWSANVIFFQYCTNLIQGLLYFFVRRWILFTFNKRQRDVDNRVTVTKIKVFYSGDHRLDTSGMCNDKLSKVK